MTSDPDTRRIDQSLENDLEEIRSVLGEQEHPEPPELLDQAVLNTARRELAEQRKQGLRRFPLRWMGAFATASVIILAIGLVVQQEQELPERGDGERDRSRMKVEAPASLAEEPVAETLPSPSSDRDGSISRRAAPAAAAPARAAEFATQSTADESAMLSKEQDAVDLESPEDWIARMLQLKSSDQQDQLARELEAFRSSYPDHPLPSELEHWLPE